MRLPYKDLITTYLSPPWTHLLLPLQQFELSINAKTISSCVQRGIITLAALDCVEDSARRF